MHGDVYFVRVVPQDDYILEITLSNHNIIYFDLKPQIEQIKPYKKLLNKAFYQTVKCSKYRIFWDDDHDFHIDQIIEASTF